MSILFNYPTVVYGAVCFFCCRVYIVAVIRPYVPTLFLGALILGSAGGGMKTTLSFYSQRIIM